MTFTRSKEWWLARALAEPDVPISAGAPDAVDNGVQRTESDEEGVACAVVEALAAPADPESQPEEGELEPKMATPFGEFVHLLRREQGLSIEEFAEQVEIDVVEAQAIEEDLFYHPEPRTVYCLAKAFHLSQGALYEFAGLTAANDIEAVEGQQRFAARSESRSALSAEEVKLLAAITATLHDRAARTRT